MNVEKYVVKVDRTLSLKEAVEAGRYDMPLYWAMPRGFNWTVGDGADEMVFHLVDFGREIINPSEVLAELDNMGLRPATLPELLALGSAEPELQKKGPIVALGSSRYSAAICPPVIVYPYLKYKARMHGPNEEVWSRELSQTYSITDEDIRFLAVAK